ncbi:MAG: phosphate signaling complex protein PhoU [Selenomonadaceae bacterium]|nr:phosphate signaling complex protein PhoU [Selenomonadaceae bacterium]
MRSYFDKQLELLNNEMLNMSDMCEDAISQAISALLNGDRMKAAGLKKSVDQINQQERYIENICVKLLMQQQPVARDLRTISAAMKMVTDMDRIAIQSGDIADIIAVGNIKPSAETESLKQMADAVKKMVTMSIEAFVNKDISSAKEVLAFDDVVDEYFDNIKKELIEKLKNNQANGELILDLLMIDKYLERIGDHAVNIGKWVIFSINGEIEIIS